MCLRKVFGVLFKKSLTNVLIKTTIKTKGPFGLSLFLLKLKHCSEIIFKCVNSIAGPIFNEKIAKK